MSTLATVHQLFPTTHLGTWIVPPEHRKQPIEVAFATCGKFIYRRTLNKSDQSKVYHRTNASKCAERDFEPWSRAPQVPASRWESCTARQAGET